MRRRAVILTLLALAGLWAVARAVRPKSGVWRNVGLTLRAKSGPCRTGRPLCRDDRFRAVLQELLADNIGGRVALTYDLAVFGLALPEIDWRVRA